MQLMQSLAQFDLLQGKCVCPRTVPSALGRLHLHAQLAQPMLDGSLVNLLDGALDLGLFGRLGLGQPFKYP